MAPDDKPNSLFDQIIAALGGTGEAAKKLGRRPSQVCQWRTRDQKFPAEIYKVLKAVLRKERLRQPPDDVFRFEDERRAG